MVIEHRLHRLLQASLLMGTLTLLPACGGSGIGELSVGPQLEARVSASGNAVAGEPLLLDGSGSTRPSSGGTLSFRWSVKAPDGSTVTLLEAEGDRPYFIPTLTGNYSVELGLRVTDGIFSASSNIFSLNISVAASPAAAPPTAGEVKSRIRSQAASAAPYQLPDATSPTITVGAADGASTINPSRLLAWNRPEFIYNGDMKVAGTVYPDLLFGRNSAVGYSSTQRAGNALTVDFVTDAASFEVFQKGLGYNSRMRVVVDGRLANTAPAEIPSDGSTRLTQVRLGSKATRSIRLIFNDPSFGGIRVATGDVVNRPVINTRLRAMFLGDSITEGPAGQDAPSSYAPRMAELLGWKDAWVSGVGSTGYLAAPAPKLTLRQRYATDVKAYAPNVLVIAAGVNDTGYSDEEIRTEASLLFDQIEADLPNTVVFVAGPLATPGRARPGIAAAVKAAVGQRSNFIYVPNAEEAWLVDGGNALQYISADRVHPTPAGIEYLAGKMAGFVRQAVQ